LYDGCALFLPGRPITGCETHTAGFSLRICNPCKILATTQTILNGEYENCRIVQLQSQQFVAEVGEVHQNVLNRVLHFQFFPGVTPPDPHTGGCPQIPGPGKRRRQDRKGRRGGKREGSRRRGKEGE